MNVNRAGKQTKAYWRSQEKGVERSLDIEAAKIEALETALIAIEQQPISANNRTQAPLAATERKTT